MTLTRKTLTITFQIDFEADDRLTEEDMRGAALSCLEMTDGRRNFSTEIVEDAACRFATSLLATASGWMVSRIERKYPGAHRYPYRMRDLFPEAKLVGHSFLPRLSVDGADLTREEFF